MKKKIVKIVIFVLFITIPMFFTYKITRYYSQREYKVAWLSEQDNLEITNFDITHGKIEHSMFKTHSDITVHIKGKVFSNGYDRYINYIQKNERLEMIDEKKVAIIEFVPVVAHKFYVEPQKPFNTFHKKFNYRVESYTDGINTYVFKCGDFEKTFIINQQK